MAKSIVVVDYHKGNLSSVERGLVRAGAQVVVTDDPRVIAEGKALVLPGVGAFFDAMEYMRASGQAQAVRTAIERGAIFLGICLGLRLLYERGCEGVPQGVLPQGQDGLLQELPPAESERSAVESVAALGQEGRAPAPQRFWTEGLGVLKGSVVRFESGTLKVPHVGWNQVHVTQAGGACPLLAGVLQDAHMYFTHSYAVDPATVDAADVAATTDYILDFPCVAWRDNVFGCQFHPEKSSSAGQAILRNFVGLACGEGGAQ